MFCCCSRLCDEYEFGFLHNQESFQQKFLNDFMKTEVQKKRDMFDEMAKDVTAAPLDFEEFKDILNQHERNGENTVFSNAIEEYSSIKVKQRTELFNGALEAHNKRNLLILASCIVGIAATALAACSLAIGLTFIAPIVAGVAAVILIGFTIRQTRKRNFILAEMVNAHIERGINVCIRVKRGFNEMATQPLITPDVCAEEQMKFKQWFDSNSTIKTKRKDAAAAKQKKLTQRIDIREINKDVHGKIVEASFKAILENQFEVDEREFYRSCFRHITSGEDVKS